MSKGSLYHLHRLHTRGLLPREEYLRRRRALLEAVRCGEIHLWERHYPRLENAADNPTVLNSELRGRRATAREHLLELERQRLEFEERRRGLLLCWVGALLLALLLGGFLLLR